MKKNRAQRTTDLIKMLRTLRGQRCSKVVSTKREHVMRVDKYKKIKLLLEMVRFH